MRKLTHKELVLNALERAGNEGCTSRDLNAICYRYSGRINELRKQGYGIETRPIKEGPLKGLARFILFANRELLEVGDGHQSSHESLL